MEKNNYVQISFHYCGLDYDYTICEWRNLKIELDQAEMAIINSDPKDYAEYGKPLIEITPIYMTFTEFLKWKKDNNVDFI